MSDFRFGAGSIAHVHGHELHASPPNQAWSSLRKRYLGESEREPNSAREIAIEVPSGAKTVAATVPSAPAPKPLVPLSPVIHRSVIVLHRRQFTEQKDVVARVNEIRSRYPTIICVTCFRDRLTRHTQRIGRSARVPAPLAFPGSCRCPTGVFSRAAEAVTLPFAPTLPPA